MTFSQLLRRRNNKKAARLHALMHQVARDPYVDWAIIFTIFVAVAVTLIIVGAITYLEMDLRSDQAAAAKPTTSSVTIDTKTLSKVLDQFDARDAERAELIKGYAGPSDPSI